MQQVKNKVILDDLEKQLEVERGRLYMIVSQCGLTGKLALKQSRILDELIINFLKIQLDREQKCEILNITSNMHAIEVNPY